MSAALVSSELQSYLVLFYHFDRHGYVDFRLEEFASLCSLYGHEHPFRASIAQVKQEHLHNPFITVQLPNEQLAHDVCARAMLTKSVYEVLVEGESVNEIILKLKTFEIETRLRAHLHRTYRVRNIYFGKKCSHDENLLNIKLLEAPFLSRLRGNVDLAAAQVEYHLIADYGAWTHLGLSEPRDTPQKVYLCRFIAGSNRDIIRQFSLKQRKYVGSTSLDSELSFLMANQAKIGDATVCLDPFCGTGSLLIASTHFGALAYGGDIDLRVLRGNKYFQHGMKKTDAGYEKRHVLLEEEAIEEHTRDHSIYANFKQYGLPRPELIHCDLSNLSFQPFDAMQLRFDAILCDPPYGLRAGGRRSGTKNPIKVPEIYHDSHHPRTQQYDTRDIMFDLLQFVAKYLRMHGRFVYLLPATIDFEAAKDLPTHPCLRLVANSEQMCQGIFRRRLITMEKCAEFYTEVVPFIPQQADFADMKNKIFFKQHSYHQSTDELQLSQAHSNRSRKKLIHKQQRNKQKQQKQDQANVNDNSGTGMKRNESPTLTVVKNPKHEKRQKVVDDTNVTENGKANID